MNLITEIGVILIIATVLGIIARLFKQPILLGYIFAGVLLGPMGFKLVTNMEMVTTLFEIGIAFLLFIVGLELDVRKLKHLGLVSLIVGLGQVIFTFSIGYGIARYLGFLPMHSFYISVALTLSSTVIVIKLLADKNELNALHARIVLGILLVQDFVAVIVLAALASSSTSTMFIINNLLIGIGLFGMAVVLGNYVLPHIFKPLAKSPEILFMSSVSWCFLFTIVTQFLGFSVAIGGLLAGISLASLPYHVEIMSRIRSLRDFFATIFFVTLGMQIVFSDLSSAVLTPIVIFTLFVLVGNPLIIMILMSVLGFKARPSFLTAVTLAQISEFSLILVALGHEVGLLSQTIVSIIAIVAVLTFGVSSYMILHDNQLFRICRKVAKKFEKLAIRKLEFAHIPEKLNYEIILCGCNRVGRGVIESAKKMKKNLLVIDFNPKVIKELSEENIHCIYGDVSDVEVLDQLNFKVAEIVISTIPDHVNNLLILDRVKGRSRKKPILILTAVNSDDALELYDTGADYVIIPHLLGSDHVSLLLQEKTKDLKKLFKSKMKHIETLHKLKNGHH